MTQKSHPKHLPAEVRLRLRWVLWWAMASLAMERIWRVFWPLATVIMAGFACVRIAPPFALLNGFIAATALACFAYGVWRLTWPTWPEAFDRLHATSRERPLAALADSLATDDSQTSAQIWDAHQARMIATTDEFHLTDPLLRPDLRIAALDPFALRFIAAVAATVAVIFFSPPAPDKGAAGLTPATASWEGWIEPPAYTNQPSLYLSDLPGGALAIPKGSRITLNFYGDPANLPVSGDVLAQSSPPASRLSARIDANGTLTIGDDPEHSWRMTATGDVPPAIRFDGGLIPERTGQFEQVFFATDDYGIDRGEASIELDLDAVTRRHGLTPDPDPRAPTIVDLPRPRRNSKRAFEAIWEEDLSENPWAGLPVRVSLHAIDEAGQKGKTAPRSLTLPARKFFDPFAKALIEQRRDLLWTRRNARSVAQILRAISHRPEDVPLDPNYHLKLRQTIDLLEGSTKSGLSEHQQDVVAEQLWGLAVEIEEGGLTDAKSRLENAQKKLEQAIIDGATQEELKALMDEVRRAMNAYLEQLQNQSQRQAETPNAPSEEAIEMDADDIQSMLDKVEELMKEGKMEEAMKMLDLLDQMTQNMQSSPGQKQPSDSQSAREGLQDTLREQQGLADDAFRDLQEQEGQGSRVGQAQGNEGRNGGEGRGQSHSGQGGKGGDTSEGNSGAKQGDGAQSSDLAGRQRALQEQLQAQRRNLPGAGSEQGQAARDALEQAGRAMNRAAEALEEGETSEALDRQAEAIEAMREGMRRFDDAMEPERQSGQQGQTPGQQGRAQRDPLGRKTGPQGGRPGSDNELAEGQDPRRQVEELLDEMRRRLENRSRPELERDYLKRLLDGF